MRLWTEAQQIVEYGSAVGDCSLKKLQKVLQVQLDGR
jgi:hypothetical protein